MAAANILAANVANNGNHVSLGAFYLDIDPAEVFCKGSPDFGRLVKINRKTQHIVCGIYLQDGELMIIQRSRCLLGSEEDGNLQDYHAFNSAWDYVLFCIDPEEWDTSDKTKQEMTDFMSQYIRPEIRNLPDNQKEVFFRSRLMDLARFRGSLQDIYPRLV